MPLGYLQQPIGGSVIIPTMRNSAKKTIIRILVALILAALAEVFLFNVRSFELIGARARNLPLRFEVAENERAAVKDAENLPRTTFRSGQLSSFPEDLRNIHFDLALAEGEKVKGDILIEQEGLLAGTRQSFELIGGIPHSMTVALYPSKPVTGFQLTLDLAPLKEINTVLNSRLAMRFDFLRFAVLFLFLAVFPAILPGEPIWNVPFNLSRWKQKAAFAGLLVLQTVVLLLTMISTYPDFSEAARLGNLRQEDYIYKQHYQLLTQALLQRSPALLEMPPERLAQAENPYDPSQRIDQFPPYLWDSSYFDGRYYIYFGITPAVTFYIPYTLLLHRYPLNDFAVLFFAVIGSVGLVGVFLRLVRKVFTHLPVLAVWLGAAILLMSVFMPWYVRRSFSYELALTSAFAFSVWGLYGALAAAEAEKTGRLALMFSGACFAAAVGCRPTALFAAVPALPFLIAVIHKEWTKPRQKKFAALTIAAFLLPYALIGGALAWYNQIRFGSFTEFGRAFQLSIQESSVYMNGNPIAAFLIGVFNYLIGVGLQFTSVFPYLKALPPATFMFGGIKEYYPIFSAFAVTPTSLFLLFPAGYWRTIRKFGKTILGFFILLLLTAVGLAGFTGAAVGTIQRYSLDFDWMIALAGLLAIFAFLEGNDALRNRKIVSRLLLFGFLVSLWMQVPLSLGESYFGRSWLELMNPFLFSKIEYAISFWL